MDRSRPAAAGRPYGRRSHRGGRDARRGRGWVPARPARPELPAAPPYGRILIFTLLDDRAADFDRFAEQAAEEVGPGSPTPWCAAIHLVPNAPMQRIFYEIYRDRAAFDRHENQPYMQRFVADRRACVLATNVIELRVKYAKVAPLPTSRAGRPAAAVAAAPRVPLPPGQLPPGPMAPRPMAPGQPHTAPRPQSLEPLPPRPDRRLPSGDRPLRRDLTCHPDARCEPHHAARPPGLSSVRDARAVIERVAGDLGVGWEERDITASPQDLREYWDQIPVTLVDGVQIDFWQVSEARLRAALGAQP